MAEKDYKESFKELENIIQRAEELFNSINVPALKKELAGLEQETCKEDFWKDKERVARVNQKISMLKRRIEPWERLLGQLQEDRELMEMALEESDTDVMNDIVSRLDAGAREFEQLETIALLSQPDDACSTFLTIHPGAGGTESQDWANMLYRMYVRWAEAHKYSVDIIDYTPGDEAGIKSATIGIAGEFAYGFLKSEGGVHRLVRISPFDANKRRHTSFASVEVMPEVPEDIDLEVNESDLRIDTYRASGAGGQHVNKTDSAVRITHLPTGIVVQCQNERSQHKNKSSAMKVLRSKLYELRQKELHEEKMEKMGEKKDISWGNQIRSYVFQPYTLVKDHRTGEETGSVDYVLDGDIDRFLYAYLKWLCTGE